MTLDSPYSHAALRRMAILLLPSLLSLLALPARGQSVALRTNALYLATTTPNIGVDIRLSSRYTLSATVGYNAFKFGGSSSPSNPKLRHWLLMPELKYWLARPFERGYVGLHALYMDYNVGGIGLIHFLRERRYAGLGAGAGLSYGYQWTIHGGWSVEASLGVGYVYMDYDKYRCGSCGKKLAEGTRHYVGPTKVAVSLIYYIR